MFLTAKEVMPEGLGFNTFDSTHLLWLLAIILFWAGAVIFYRRLYDKKRDVMRFVIGSCIIVLEIVKDTIAALTGSFTAEYLPLHLCGINILLIGFDMFKQTKTVRNFLYYFCIPGALLALVFPNWTAIPCFNFYHIHSFLIHALLVSYPLLLVSTNEIETGLSGMGKSLGLLLSMAVPIYFINIALGTNFMFLMNPETGNPLGLFEKYLGSHLWGFPVLLPVVMLVMYIPLYIISKKKKSI